MHHHNINNNSKVSEIKVIMWLFYDVTMLGVGGYTLVNTFADNVNMVEKIVLFLASMIFFAYRIYILHLDAEKKRMDNREQKREINSKNRINK